MRLFIAVEIPRNVRVEINSLLEGFRALAPNVKWVRAENLHLTLKFLGETDVARRSAIEQSLASIHSTEPFTLSLGGLGFFPNAKRPRVFWAGIQSSPDLQPFVSNMDSAMKDLGFPLEDRPLTPHLTLARFSQPVLPPMLATAIAENAARNFGSFIASQFDLIESKLKSTGAEYTTLQSFSFVTEAER
jgi:RNA 2',3'-cyclic 3'-phosphodiesterase